jgi:uncharacterized protein (DUF1330 family)
MKAQGGPMKSIIWLGLVALVSFIVGAFSTNVLHAAGSDSPAYLIANITNVTKPEMLKRYQSVAPAINAKFGGRVLVRGKAVTVDPTTPAPAGTIVLIQFPDIKHLTDWYNSPEYGKIKSLRENSSTTNEYAVEGLHIP